jgi:hypothetical protein
VSIELMQCFTWRRRGGRGPLPSGQDAMEFGPHRRPAIISMLLGSAAFRAYPRHVDRGVRSLRKFIGPGLMLAVMGLVAACTSPLPAPPTPVAQASLAQTPTPQGSASPTLCALEYRAFLDLADLARRYGRSAEVFLDPLGDMVDQLDQCLAAAQGSQRLLQTKRLEISTEGASTRFQ